MARRPLSEEHIRKIQKTSRSLYVTLPVQWIREFEWEVGDEVSVEKFPQEKSAPAALRIAKTYRKKQTR